MQWLDDPDVTDIMILGSRDIHARRRGSDFEPIPTSWQSDTDLFTTARTIGRQLSRKIDKKEPMLDSRLPDMSRVCVVVDPCYNRGACIIIRKFPEHHFTLEDLVGFGALDKAGMTILEAIMRLGRNILICGGTGSGKTTLLNSLCGFIPEGVVVVTVEDVREISISHRLWIPLETKRAFDKEDHDVTLHDLIRTSLRMNPRWIIVGEVRDKEASVLARAFNTGHCGLGTIHANSAYDSLLALENLIAQAENSGQARTAKEQVARAIQIVIHMEELPDHSRRLMEIAEVQGLDYARSANFPPYKLQTLYRYEFDHYDDDGKACGRFIVEHTPSWINRLRMIPGYQMPSFWHQQKEIQHHA